MKSSTDIRKAILAEISRRKEFGDELGTTSAVASAAGVDRSSLARWLTGGRESVTTTFAEAVMNALELTIASRS